MSVATPSNVKRSFSRPTVTYLESTLTKIAGTTAAKARLLTWNLREPRAFFTELGSATIVKVDNEGPTRYIVPDPSRAILDGCIPYRIAVNPAVTGATFERRAVEPTASCEALRIALAKRTGIVGLVL
jgi:hypothetical protein